jgi:DNA-binding NtrC family response regulator
MNQAFPEIPCRLASLMRTQKLMTKNIHHKSVLVVDDDERMLRALDRVLTGEGATVICSSWAGGAIGILTEKKTRVDLVIIDLCMPFISGLTAVYAIHSHFPKLPIVILTGFGSPKVRDECLNQGAVAFLEKPLDASVLIEAVKGALSPQEPATNGWTKKINERKE